MKVKELTQELRERGLATSGTKAVLIARLEEDERERQLAMDQAEEDAGLEEGDDEGNDEEEEEEEEQEEDEEEEEDAVSVDNEEQADSAGDVTSAAPPAADYSQHATSGTWQPAPGLFSWIFSVNTLVAALCLSLAMYNNPAAEAASSAAAAGQTEPQYTIPVVGLSLDGFVNFLCQNPSLLWTIVLLCFTVAYTHSEPDKCQNLRGGDLVRVRSYLLNTQFFYLVFATSDFGRIDENGEWIP